MDKSTNYEWVLFSEGMVVPGCGFSGPLNPNGQQQWSEKRR
jgi:hypothetical protein